MIAVNVDRLEWHIYCSCESCVESLTRQLIAEKPGRCLCEIIQSQARTPIQSQKLPNHCGVTRKQPKHQTQPRASMIIYQIQNPWVQRLIRRVADRTNVEEWNPLRPGEFADGLALHVNCHRAGIA